MNLLYNNDLKAGREDETEASFKALNFGMVKSGSIMASSPNFKQVDKLWQENPEIDLGRFLALDFHMDYSKKRLIESFYRSITDDTPIPIPYREILLTSKIMDTIFGQIATKNRDSQKCIA